MNAVYAVCINGTSPGSDYYTALDETDKAKLNALFARMAEHGVIKNETKFKKITGTEFFEFKSHQIRMPCYYVPGRLLVITHGFNKKTDRMPPAEIARAERIRREDAEYFASQGDTAKWRN
ncbi:MAG: type II toxin-antitoxin system RelE/ParE family toxin [Bryobacteraceae bacterium]|jgi:phage-related protein